MPISPWRTRATPFISPEPVEGAFTPSPQRSREWASSTRAIEAPSANTRPERPPVLPGLRRAWYITSTPVLDGRVERAVIRTVPRITLRGLQRSSRARRLTPCRTGTASARRTPVRSSERTSANGRAARPEWFPTTNRCSSSPGVSCEDGNDLVRRGRCVDARRSGVAAAYRRSPMLRSTNLFARSRGCSQGRLRAKSSAAP